MNANANWTRTVSAGAGGGAGCAVWCATRCGFFSTRRCGAKRLDASPLDVLQLCRATIDGGYDYHREISRAFAADRVVSAFVRNDFDAARVADYHGAVHFLRGDRYPLLKRPRAAAWKLARLGERPFDLILCHHHLAARIGAQLRRRQRGGRLVYVVHDFGYFDAADRHGRRRRRFVERQLRDDDRLVTVSASLRRQTLADLPRFDPQRCEVIPNALDVDAFLDTLQTRDQARAALALPASQLVFGSVGRLVPYKAQRDLIAAFAQLAERLPQARLLLIGRGPERDRLAAQIDRLGLRQRARLCGFVPQASRLMTAFDVFVLPSRREPFGLVLLEAMAQRVPIVAAADGAAPEVLAEAGRLYPPGDVDALAARLLELALSTAAQRRRLGDAGFRRLRRYFDIGAYRQRYRALADGLRDAR